MYRNNVSVTPGPDSLSRSSSSFYTFDNGGDHHYTSPHPGGHHNMHQSVTPQSHHRLETADLTSKVDQMMTMLSSTQQLLVSQQATTVRLEETVAKLTQDVTDLKSASVAASESASGTKGSQKPKCKKIPKELSNAVKHIHSSVDDDKRFVGSELFSSDSNQTVASYLCGEVKAEFGTKYDGNLIKRAVYRYFESRRRIHNDSLPHRKDAVAINRKKAQKKACQTRVYERRKVLKNAKEKKKFQQIDYRYMTEESTSEGNDDVVRTHKLPWRSDKLNDFIETLDSRIKKSKEDSHTSGGFSLKSTIESVLSTSSPPANAPPWSTRSLDDGTATQEASGSTAQPSLELDEPSSSSSEADARTIPTVTSSRARFSNHPECRKRLTIDSVHEALSEGSGFQFSDSDLD